MHIQTLKIENLRSFKSVELDFNVPTTGDMQIQYPNVNVLLGDNGLGKTSVLRAVALSVLGPLLSGSSGFVPEGLVRRISSLPNPEDSTAAKISLKKTPSATITATILSTDEEKKTDQKSEWLPDQFSLSTNISSYGSTERMRYKVTPRSIYASVEFLQFNENNPAFFIVGYGATRRVEASTRVDESARNKSRLRRYERVASLFEDHLTLMPLSYWLPEYAKTNKGRYTQVINLINELLPKNCQIQKTAEGREHLFEMNGVVLPFSSLSDGFKAYIGWIGDMLFHVCQGVSTGLKLREMRGVVMVDEIDLHLHPEWQRIVVPTLAKALPNVQFIFTTHSPLVVGSLTSQNLFLLVQEKSSTVIRRLPEHVKGKSSEQILLSPYFGLESTRSTGTAAKLKDLARNAVSGNIEASARYLKIMAADIDFESMRSTPETSSSIKRKKEGLKG